VRGLGSVDDGFGRAGEGSSGFGFAALAATRDLFVGFPILTTFDLKFEGFKRFAKVWSLFQAQLRSKFLSQLPTGHKRNFFGEIIFGKLP
jgi:hypothetical protein